jgi:addiction module HigA family antidote
MIVSFRDEWLRAFFVEDARSRHIASDLESRLFRKLQMVDDAATDQDLRVPPSNHFEKLRGNLAGFHSDPHQQSVATDLPVGRQSRRGRRRLSRRPQLQMRRTMLTTKRKPATVGEILVEEFMRPMGLTQAALAQAMGVQRKHVNELCNNRRTVTAATALILARVFGNSADFWLNVQRRNDLWEAMNNPRERERIERATPLGTAA